MAFSLNQCYLFHSRKNSPCTLDSLRESKECVVLSDTGMFLDAACLVACVDISYKASTPFRCPGQWFVAVKSLFPEAEGTSAISIQCPEDCILNEPHWKKKRGPFNIVEHISVTQSTLTSKKLCFI